MSLRVVLPLLFSFAFSTAGWSAELLSAKGNRNIESFGEAKRLLHKIQAPHQLTFYCGCKYYGKDVNMNSCQSYSPGQSKRFTKLEWEHVVPAERFGHAIDAWRSGSTACKNKKGRKCAEKTSPLFRQMEADMYNLWPESGGINQARSNKPPLEEVSGKLTTFGQCQTVVGKKGFVPRQEIRGEIARSYMYMSDTYGIPLSDEERKMFQEWNETHPVDAWECERTRKIESLQGNVNHFVKDACEAAKL
jgi:deoxyribonuclease-1